MILIINLRLNCFLLLEASNFNCKLEFKIRGKINFIPEHQNLDELSRVTSWFYINNEFA
jgi:hypothetical protein